MKSFTKILIVTLAALAMSVCAVLAAVSGTVITTVKPQVLENDVIMGTGWYQMVNDNLLPVNRGSAGQVLSKDASGSLVWRDPAPCVWAPLEIVCGTAKNGTFASNPPDSELCTDGLTRTVTPSGSLYIWSCSASAVCSAYMTWSVNYCASGNSVSCTMQK